MLFGKTKTENAAAASDASEFIFDATDADFEQSVLMASMDRPVIADFWAPWCGPCKQLTPALEKTVADVKGAVLLAKINIDENQGIAAALRIQSIPTVFAFFQGRPVDAFQGAVSPAQIKAFVDKLVQISKSALPDALDIPAAMKSAAQALAEKNLPQAQALYAQILHQDEKNAQAYVGLARVLIAADELEQAKNLVDGAPPEISCAPVFSEALSALELAQTKPAGKLEDLLGRVAASPDDHQARYDLALAQFSEGEREEAIDSLIEIIRRSRTWNEEAARKQLLKFFDALGPADPLVVQGRRKLSSALFS